MAGEVTFTATEADYIVANLLWTRKARQTRLLGWLAIAGISLAALALALGWATGRTVRDTIADSIWMLIFAAVVIGIRIATPYLIKHQVRTMLTQNVALREPVHCRWTEDAIHFTGSNGTADLPWARLHRWLHDDKVFVFLQTDRLMYVVPTRCLTADQSQDLNTVAEAILGKADR